MTDGTPPQPFSDPFGTKEAIQLAFKKLSSQALVYSLAIIVVIVGASALLGPNAWPVIVAILVVFVIGIAAYLFAEQKQKIAREDPRTMSELATTKLEAIANQHSEFTVQLSTAPATEPATASRDIAVSRAIAKNDYRIGDRIVVRFQASRDCYLTLLNIGTSGKLTILFPNALHPENRITANTLYEIPGPDYGFSYILEGEPGLEKLKAIATLEKVSLMETQFSPDGAFFATRQPTAAARDIAIVKEKTSTLPADKWTEASCEFQVRN